MSEHAPRLTAPWLRPIGGTVVWGGDSTSPTRWGLAAAALLAAMVLIGVAVVDPTQHPIIVLWMLTALAAMVATTWRVRAATERLVVVLGDDRAAARIVELVGGGRRSLVPNATPVRVRRAATWSEAASLVASAAGAELVFAGSAFAPAVPLFDAAGRPAPIVTGAEAIQRRLGRVPLDLVGQDRWFRQLGAVRPVGALYAAAKRAIDVAAALVVGLLMLPLIPLVALAIRLESPGPVFYSQTRVGLGGRRFRIVKFRSMRQDAERDGARWAQAGDSRVTKVGRVMRLTRIDELPQIWNVLKGEMTLVGPRPERPEFTDTLEQEIPHYGKRLAVKPGLTGWAQVRFRYTASVEDTARKLEYDLYYLKHASLLLDLRILVATIGVVLRKAGC